MNDLSNYLIILFISVISINHAQSQVIFKNGFEPVISLINDTGITYASEYPSGNNASCTSTTISPLQDCDIGRDVTHNDDSNGLAGFSYTKLDDNGNELLASALEWACVRDNITGFVWEIKTNDNGIHDKDNTYRWGGITHQGSFGTEFYSDWDSLVNGSNSETLCGFDDWQVPDKNQLTTLLNLGQFAPTVDIEYFPQVSTSNSYRYWTSTPNAKNTDNAWFIAFDFGSVGNLSRSGAYGVRLVRFGQ
jgi:hypothetical protein